MRRFGHSLLSLVFRTPVLVLTTTGRVSGMARDTPLAYLSDGEDRLLVVGGAAGQARLPDWVANLRADSSVEVTIDGTTRPMHAVELSGTERDDAWVRAVARWPRVERYQARAGRAVPMVRLVPRSR